MRTIELPQTPKRKARQAELEILAIKVVVKPPQYYTWQKQLFENGERAYQRCNGNDSYSSRHFEQQIAKLKDQLVRRSEAMAVLLQDYVELRADAR